MMDIVEKNFKEEITEDYHQRMRRKSRQMDGFSTILPLSTEEANRVIRAGALGCRRGASTLWYIAYPDDRGRRSGFRS